MNGRDVRSAGDSGSDPRPGWSGAVRLEGSGKTLLDVGRDRLLIAASLFALGFLILSGRLVEVALLGDSSASIVATAQRGGAAVTRMARADIIDRNGFFLATSLTTQSLYADARLVRDAAATMARLREVLPKLDGKTVRDKLASGRGFVWIRRNLTPRQVAAVNNLGEPALAFLAEQRRVYPHGALAAHVIGYAGIDNRGLAGIERAFDERLLGAPGEPLRLSLDLRFQHVLREELAAAVESFRAIGAAGVVLDVDTGAVAAMVSLPDFDPNRPGTGDREALFNRASLGTYEMGSTFKSFTVAMALDAGAIGIGDGYDTTEPLRLARHTIRDFHAESRWLSVPEIFIHSSNIGAAKMALAMGTERQRAYLDRFGLLGPAPIELPEVAQPLVPDPWRDINTATIGFGHGIAVSPIQLAAGIAALVNGGIRHAPSLLWRDADAVLAGVPAISPRTSCTMRQLMHLVVAHGTGRKAATAGYPVGGKTGTAEKIGENGYDRRRLVSSFVGVFPINRPRYLVLVLLDEPKGNDQTHGYATGGWTAAPVVGRVIARIGPLSGIAPVELPEPGEDSGTEPGMLRVNLDGSEIRLAAF
ncbi:MAG: penicillin-binding protein 2 [Alphaproteobacteria bacterium]|jgi:cell division protein FtsI (penicillin-binding protein 3)|nr:penicillin-binding protein 2 [Alphaproteobacteria bacterium]